MRATTSSSSLLAGTASVDITPAVGSRFVGHLNRNRPAEGVLDPLGARFLHLEDRNGRLLLVNCDLLEFGPAEAGFIAAAAAEGAGVGPGEVVLTATHTHTGPATIELAAEGADEAYLSFLAGRIRGAAAEASRSAVPCTARTGKGACGIGVNRRRNEGGRIVMAPNFEGPADPEVLVLVLEDESGRARAALINHSVHPTTLSVDSFLVSADYPGRTAKHLGRLLGGDCPVFFLQGACGDVKPAVLTPDGTAFREGTEEDIERMGYELAEAAAAAALAARPVAALRLRRSRRQLSLRFAGLPSKAELIAEKSRLEDEIRLMEAAPVAPRSHIDPLAAARVFVRWADLTIERLEEGRLRDRVDSEISGFALGTDFAFAGIPGELFSEIGTAIKRTSPFPATCVAGYCGGSLGYLPTRRALLEGGYEAADAFKFYGHPAAFRPDTEDAIIEACKDLLETMRCG